MHGDCYNARMHLTWVEISESALTRNVRQFKRLVGNDRTLCVAVKANAYGHGLVEASRIMLKSGADWLGVNALYEARLLREAGISAPIYCMGYIPLSDLESAIMLDCRMVVYNRDSIVKLSSLAQTLGKKARVHIKVETGNNRQGIPVSQVLSFARFVKNQPCVTLEGVSTHFANIEDTTDHSYAEYQSKEFQKAIDALEQASIKVPFSHAANSAATILFPYTYNTMVRVGIGAYGMWPSQETMISARDAGLDITLEPVLTWKTRIAQVKKIPKDSFVGYGCTHKTTRDTTLAILPVGYYDGYDRRLSGSAHVLIHGKRAKILGRVCMNIMMADVTDISDVFPEDEVVLLGRQGDETISAERLAAWIGTINYEVTTRINERIPRVVVEDRIRGALKREPAKEKVGI